MGEMTIQRGRSGRARLGRESSNHSPVARAGAFRISPDHEFIPEESLCNKSCLKGPSSSKFQYFPSQESLACDHGR
jgi:hypothetical protein